MIQNWVNAVLGLVVIGVAFMGFSAATLTWTLVVVGAAIAIVGFWGATAEGGGERASQR